MDKIKVCCGIEIVLKMIGGKCKLLILYYLAGHGTKRFNELLKYVTQISQKTLSNQLREMGADGLIKRQAFAEIPPKVEYSITEKGLSLLPILEMMCKWGESNIGDRFEMVSPPGCCKS